MTVRAVEDGTVRNDLPDSDDFGLVVRVVSDTGSGASSFQNGAETAVGTGAAVLVLAANAIANGVAGSRVAAVIQNTGASNVRIGIAGVTATTGVRLIPNAIAILEGDNLYRGEVWAIGEGGASIVFTQESVAL